MADHDSIDRDESVQSEADAFLVEWIRGGETWVHAHADEPTAVDQARKMGGTCTPLFRKEDPENFTQGFHAGCCEAARMLREAADDHKQTAEASRKVLDAQANELAAALLLSWANGIEITANRVASGKFEPRLTQAGEGGRA